jgi:hypothetical protein
MVQFDPLILFTLLVSTIFVLIFYYNISLDILIPYFFGVKKFRERKLDLLITIRLLKLKVNAVLSAFTKGS